MHTEKQGGEKCQTEVFFTEILQGVIFFYASGGDEKKRGEGEPVHGDDHGGCSAEFN